MALHIKPWALLVLNLAVASVAACASLPVGARPPGPAPTRTCVAVYSADRCQAMLTAAAESLGVADDEVTAIEIAPDPTPRPDGILQTLGGARPIVVLAHVGAAVHEVPMCMGIPSGPPCMNVPAWEIVSAIGGGYSDVPCAGEPPDGCASPVPSRDPESMEAARSLRIEQHVIAVPRVGPYEVRIGAATLPNGLLTVAHAQLADPWPDAVRLSSEGIRLEIRSQVPGRPGFWNIYEHGWYPGTEAVDVFLVFEARHVEPGATIEIRDVVVG